MFRSVVITSDVLNWSLERNDSMTRGPVDLQLASNSVVQAKESEKYVC